MKFEVDEFFFLFRSLMNTNNNIKKTLQKEKDDVASDDEIRGGG